MIKSVKKGSFKLLPPRKDVCQACAAEHKPEEPHNRNSLFYQVGFFAKHTRWPTWLDAMKHCAKSTQKAWLKELAIKGVKIA